MKMTKTANKLFKSYLFTIVMKEAKKLAEIDYARQARNAQRMLKNIDWDKKRMLNKVGLTTYSPGRATLGTGLLLIAGAGLGALAAMTFAPMRGEDFRQTIKDKAGGLMHRDEFGQTQAEAHA